MIRLPRFLLGFAVLALAGCGSVLPAPAPPPALYRLTPAADFAAGPRPVAVQLGIDAPSAEAALDTTRIALTRSPTTLDYFAAAAWTDRLSTMLQALLVESFDNAHRLAAIGPQSGALRPDIVLVTELRHFEALYNGTEPPRWQIEITAKLVKLPERTLLADRDFHADAAAARNDLVPIVEAADAAWHGVAKDIVDWSADTLSRTAH